MYSKFLKIVLILTSYVFLTGFLPISVILGPGLTIASSGNIYKASAQFIIDRHIKNKTGKNSLAFVKEEVTKKNSKKNFNKDFSELVKKRVTKGHQRIVQQNYKKNLNKNLRQLVKKRITKVHKKLDSKKIN